jgi:sugar lactone lactonase YvrE
MSNWQRDELSSVAAPIMRGEPHQVGAAGALLGESPAWDDRTDRLLWVDIWSGTLHATDPRTETTTTTDIAPPLSAVVLSTRGTSVVTAGLCVLELTADGPRHIADVPEPPCMRANDAAVDPAGRLWIGTMTLPQRPTRTGGLWRLDGREARPVEVIGDVALANGIAWSPSGDVMYFVDSLRHRIAAYTFDAETGGVGDWRTLAQIAPEDGIPDGIAVDVDGGVWVVLAGGAAVRRYTEAGTLTEVVDLPMRHPTSCTFGGTDLAELYVTSGVRSIDPTERPTEIARGAGAVFQIPVSTSGLPSFRMDL